MYKIMLADDEGIVIDSLKFIIEKNFGKECTVEFAKTGRSVIELAESFRPDIAIMDIQMPGINGIEAMKEIRKVNHTTIFIIMSAYDKFDYAKEAINLGVLDYLNKPVSHEKIVEVLKRAMNMIDEEKKKRANELMIREKIENVVPVIESGLIYNVLLQEGAYEDTIRYKELLGIEENFGYLFVVECGDNLEGTQLSNTVGAGVRIQSRYSEIRQIIKDDTAGVVGPIMANRIVVFSPVETSTIDYNQRTRIIERCRNLVEKLVSRIDIEFRVGIGTVKGWDNLVESYKEAVNTLKNVKGVVVHYKDVNLGCAYEENYPIETEKALFDKTLKGDVNGTVEVAKEFFNWMVESHKEAEMDIKLKVLEFVLWAEHLAYENSGMTYHFQSRTNYLPTILECHSYDDLERWFIGKVSDASRSIMKNIEEQSNSAVDKARAYIANNFRFDISLDDVSREVDISPYYFSKLFKEETGANFIEYLTGIRINKAKELIENSGLSMKEICTEVGYQDPNYFSRIFKKNVGVTPTEYKEGL